jgi:integrase
LAYEAADCGLLSADLAAGIRRVKGAKRLGVPVGNWLPAEQGKRPLLTADSASVRGKRDYATLAILLGCGLRRAELTALRVEDIQQREEHWVIADLVGKGGHIRTIPVPDWVKAGIDSWMLASGITTGTLLRSINKAGRIWGAGFSPKVIWGVVKEKAKDCEIPALAPHDLRRTCARLCHQAGGELEQIQFLLGHVSVQTTERYLGCKQRFRNAVNDRIGLEPDGVSIDPTPLGDIRVVIRVGERFSDLLLFKRNGTTQANRAHESSTGNRLEIYTEKLYRLPVYMKY